MFINDGKIDALPVPNKNISRIGFEIINRLNFYYYKSLVLNFPTDLLSLAVFEYALTNCPRLDHFELKQNCSILVSRRLEENVSRSPGSMQENLKVVSC